MKNKEISRSKKRKSFPIVGLGASAGGIQAFGTVLSNLDPNLGMAYVLIMHLSPNHKSALTEIMQSKTKMHVQTVKNGMEVKTNNVYVIPPNTFMSLIDGRFKLAPRSPLGTNQAVDFFLTALASNYKNKAIGVILSGTASDGTLGLKAIKAECGITFAQDETAEFSGMPSHASDSGFVDFKLAPEEIAHELARLSKTPYAFLAEDQIEATEKKEASGPSLDLKRILSIVKIKYGVDFFNHYKKASITRRVMRRMTLNKFDNLHDYHAMIIKNPKEAALLYKDFLINVTSFFRDKEFYKVLESKVFPALIKNRNYHDVIRIWVAGCSTGEEAFSITICLLEFLKKRKLTIPIQVFASDLDDTAIEMARTGSYPASALQGVSKKYIEKYFIKTENYYQIAKEVRQHCIFSQHNLLKDPPFPKIDLVSCQNVLIYLESDPQKKIIDAFHYSLKSNGFLFLGKSETIGSPNEMFESLNKKVKLFSRKSGYANPLNFIIPPISFHNGLPKKQPTMNSENSNHSEKELNKLMLSNYVYPSLVVNKSLTIVEFFGVTTPYLEPVTGRASLNILKMVRKDLIIDLGSLLFEARKNEKKVSKENILIISKKVPHQITIEVIPKKIDDNIHFLVVFKETGIVQPDLALKDPKSRSGRQENRIQKLEEELALSREVIRTTNEEYETTYEELQANHEEILSSNEELQSVNEELETSKAELQASNEELISTNDELHKRNIEISESQKALKKVNAQLEQFAFVSSHDLQEPLRKIETFSGMLLSEEGKLNKFSKEYAIKIKSASRRMSVLIRDILSFSTLTDQHEKRSEVNLQKTVQKVIEDFEVTIQEKGAIIKYESLPIVHAQPVQMNQLFANLIGNALKFSKENPVISIIANNANAKDRTKYPDLMSDTKYISIKVQDNGIGFNQKYANKIFLLFQKLNDKKDPGGTGLGLSLSKKIVEDHNGFIFANGKENEGATFTIFLPENNSGYKPSTKKASDKTRNTNLKVKL